MRADGYIMTLAVLPAYRRLGLGKRLIAAGHELAAKHKETVKELTLHVQVGHYPRQARICILPVHSSSLTHLRQAIPAP